MPWEIPEIERCCGCVKDLKIAVAIIAVLGIVTSPAVSWAVVRHSYVIRVSCFITTSDDRADVVDINLNNILSFGFGANAGLGPSCLGPFSSNKTAKAALRAKSNQSTSEFVNAVKYIGWFVLLADMIFLCASVYFLYKIFHGPDLKASTHFMRTASISIVMSFLYGMLYISACISIGGSFPIFEFVFSIVDVLIWLMWIYFILVIRTYIRAQKRAAAAAARLNENSIYNSIFNLIFNGMDYLYQYISYFSLYGRNTATQPLGRVRMEKPISSVLPVVEAFCCFITVRSGSFFIGVICLVYSIWHIFYLFKMKHEFSKLKGFLGFLNYLAILLDLLLLFYSLVFIYAVVKENIKHIKTYMIILLTSAVFLLLFTFISSPMFYKDTTKKFLKNKDWPSTIIFSLVPFVVFYFLIVINSYYLIVKTYAPKKKPCET